MERRLSTTERGYGHKHQVLRQRFIAEWHARLRSSIATLCVRCGEPLEAGQSVDLDHRDDRQRYSGLAHSSCNRSTAGRNPRGVSDPKPELRTAW